MNNKAHAQFGQLRQMMQQPPSKSLWMALIAFMESHNPKIQEDTLLPYIKGHLKRWPDDLRTWHKSWTKRFLKGQLVPAAGMATQMVISNRHLHQYPIESLARHSSYIDQIRSLHLEQESHLTMPFIAQFLSLPMFEHLEALHLEMNDVTQDHQMAFLAALDGKPLKKLKNDYCIHFNTHSIRELIGGERWPQLSTLHLGSLDQEIQLFEEVVVHENITEFGLSMRNTMPWWNWARARQWLKHINHLVVGHYYADGMPEHTCRLLAEIELDQCQTLNINTYGIQPEDVIQALLKNSTLVNLRAFHCGGCSFWHNKDALRTLLNAPHLHDDLKTFFQNTYHL